MYLKIDCFARGSWTVLSPFGDLDMAGAPGFRQAVVREVAEGHNQLIVDLSAVTFVDSSGLGAIIGALRRTRAHGGDLALVCPDSEIWRAFELCDLDRVFEFHPNLDAAVDQPGGVSR